MRHARAATGKFHASALPSAAAASFLSKSSVCSYTGHTGVGNGRRMANAGWRSGNSPDAIDVGRYVEVYPSDQEDPTASALAPAATPPASMSHVEHSFDSGWIEESDGLQGTAVFDATGDKSTMPSWDELVRQHADRVYRLAYRLSGNQHDAEDLTQETFIRVFRSLQNYQPGTFEGWLHRITTNLFLDMVRRRARIRMESLPEDYDRVPADEPDPEQIYHDSRLGPDLQAALDSLPPEFRAAVVLCDIEGLSYEEIGATLGVKLGTVRSRIHRGRQALRDYLTAHGSAEQLAARSA
jgi:RNA polymerase sigma-70 factor, ECF subfamily